MALNKKLKELREKYHMTQQQLADKLFVSRQTVCRWESGARCPDLIMARRLASELGVTLDDLLSEEDPDEVKNVFPFHSERIKERGMLEKRQKQIVDAIQLFGSICLAISLFFRVRLEMEVPVWIFFLEAGVIAALFLFRYRLSRKLDDLYGTDHES